MTQVIDSQPVSRTFRGREGRAIILAHAAAAASTLPTHRPMVAVRTEQQQRGVLAKKKTLCPKWRQNMFLESGSPWFKFARCLLLHRRQLIHFLHFCTLL